LVMVEICGVTLRADHDPAPEMHMQT